MTKLKWLELMSGRLWNNIVNATLRTISPKMHDRYIDSIIEKNPECRVIVDAMAVVGRIAIEYGLQDSPTLKAVSSVLRGDLEAAANYELSERILTSSYPGRAFISAVVRNGEWDRRCKYNIADPRKRKLIDVPVRYFSIS